MYLGILGIPASGVEIHRSYHRRGRDEVLTPRADVPSALCWRWGAVMDQGVDVHLALSCSCFIDRVTFTQEEGSAIAGAALFAVSPDGGALRALGRITAATGGALLAGDYAIEAGAQCARLILRLSGCLSDIRISPPCVFGCAADQPPLYPPPFEARGMGSAIPVPRRICTSGAPEWEETERFAADELHRRLREESGIDAALSSSAREPAFFLHCVQEDTTGPEGYSLWEEQGSYHLRAGGRRGLLYGVQTLMELVHGDTMDAVRVEDHPRMALRGVHLGLPARADLPFFYRLIRGLLAPMRYNTLFLQITAGMRFERHPELNEAWVHANEKAASGAWPPVPHGDMIAGGNVLEQEEVRALADYARSYGLEVIPEIQSLGHVQYITLAHPELAELSEEDDGARAIDARDEDIPPSLFYRHSCCPQNEAYYTLLEDVIDEIVCVVRPQHYVHMGHDEVYQIGLCPRCREEDPAALFARDVTRLHDYLAGKGLGMMMWADMLQPVSPYQTPPAIERIPKDIVLLDFIWYFHPEKDIEDNLLPQGFPVVLGNMYSSHFPRYEDRIAKPGVIGAQTSTWCRPDEAVLGREGKLYDLLYSACMMWCGNYDHRLRHVYEARIRRLLPRVRAALRGETPPSLRRGAAARPVALPEPCHKAPASLQRALELHGRVEVQGVPFDVSRIQRIPQGGQVALSVGWTPGSLLFLHAATVNAARIPWEPLPTVGSYTVEFQDGTSECVTVEYGGTLAAFDRRALAPLPGAYYRHTGYLATYFADALPLTAEEGDPLTLYAVEWINHACKPVSRVTARSHGETDCELLLAAVTGMES